jgi:hypothetical protein
MDLLNKSELKRLMVKERQWCVSIYMPTHRVGRATQQDPIRLKNLLTEAENQLSARNVGRRDIQKMLEPATNLLHDSGFWQHQRDGLAIFLTPNLFRNYRLPLNFNELVSVEDNFYIKPLMPLFTGDGQFYILALSMNEIRLLSGTRYSVSEIDTGELIGSMNEAIPSSDSQTDLQIHIHGTGAQGQSGTFHGHAGGEEDKKENLLRYFLLVEDALTEHLQGDEVPLILAGVDYLLPIYKKANKYPHLVDEGITGNPETLSEAELHKSAWEILEPFFKRTKAEAIAKYQQLAGQASDQATDSLEKIIPAAMNGRIEILFVSSGMQQWGTFNPANQKVELHDKKEPGDEQLVDLAVVQTYLNGGKVYVVEPEKVPSGTPISAILRY